MTKSHQSEAPNISSFILKLSKLLEDARFKNVINWTPDGTSITIDSHNEGLDSILAKYFNHSKISSFVRQLNLYGFKKVSERDSQMMYKHQNFIKDEMNLRRMIKRKRKIKKKCQQIEAVEEKIQNPILEKQKTKVKGLEDIYFRIKKENQKIQNQSLYFITQTSTLQRIKQSNFFTCLKNQYSEKWTKSEQNFIYQNSTKSSSNEQHSSPDTSVVQVNQFAKNQQNDDRFYPDGQNLENEQNREGSDNNNEMDMFREKIEEIDCVKMSMNPDREESFWKQDQGEIEEREQQVNQTESVNQTQQVNQA